MKYEPTEWDKAYIKGTLRKPTNLDKMYPAPTQPVAEAQPYAYIDDLGRLAGQVLAGAALSALVLWLIEGLS